MGAGVRGPGAFFMLLIHSCRQRRACVKVVVDKYCKLCDHGRSYI